MGHVYAHMVGGAGRSRMHRASRTKLPSNLIVFVLLAAASTVFLLAAATVFL